jgi:transcriptional regulator with XRE-family HTH domain
MSAKASTPVDKFIGARLRARRLLVRMSQERLGEALGITFQQIQKYEKGTNRISVSRLHQIAQVLGVPVGYFYDGAPGTQQAAGPREAAGAADEADFLSNADGLQLMHAFLRIDDPRVRRRLVDLANAIAEQGPEGGSAA